MSETRNNLSKNTAIMYIRMAVIMLINLYTVRVVLNALGEIDYGIYDVVAGVVTLLASISGVLSSSCQRFYSFKLGKNDTDGYIEVFSASINVYVAIALIVLLIGEALGPVVINRYLDIPADRLSAANWIYHFALFAFICNLVNSPFLSSIIAHEDMGLFAVISIAECVLKLSFAICMSYIAFDHLFFYGGYLFLISLFILFAYVLISVRKYSVCKYRRVNNNQLYKEFLSFSGWTLFGSLAGLSLFQATTILLNVFFGPIVSAARAISIQVYSALNSFANNFLMVIKPPLIKEYAGGDFGRLNFLFSLSNKTIYYSLLLICLPLIFEMEGVLLVWLKTNDPQTILFSKLMIIYAIIMAIGNPITYIVQATGKIKSYFTKVEFFTILCAPVVFILFKLGFGATASFWAMIVAATLSHLVRIICLKKVYNEFDVKGYFISFVIPAFFITIICSIICLGIVFLIKEGLIRFVLLTAINAIIVIFLSYIIGLSKNEKQLVVSVVNKIVRKWGIH